MKAEALSCDRSRVQEEHCTGGVLRSLLNPDSYPERPAEIAHAETHISDVFLTDRRAYKVKKAVRFPFLDYSTRELRLQACEDEIRLNRRLAPEVYVAVRPITAAPGGVEIDGNGEIVDFCVEMKRLPADRMLDYMIRGGTATCEHIDKLLDVLIPFYAHSQHGPEIVAHATAAAVELNARQNLTMIGQSDHGWPRSMLQRVRCSQLQFLKLSGDLFAARIRSRRVCEGHGDLRPEHVCMLGDRPVVFDCVEFSLPLRVADVISELAFLAMECDFLGAPDLGNALIQGYQKQSGDDAPESLTNFYKSYRACVRAKVELLRAGQEVGEVATRSRSRARRYLQLASCYAAQFYRPKLFVMIGAAGTGKSTVADALADALGLEVLRTDAIRHEIAGRREPNAEFGKGIYSDPMNCLTYETLFDRTATLLNESVSLVLDGTFCDPRQRHRAFQLAHELGAGIQFVQCRCPGEIARGRIASRIRRGDAISDARPDLYDVQQRQLDSSDDLQTLPVTTVDTTQPTSSLVELIIKRG
jgi:aminoglycoside phosphotransferase family enzyme/predicted kinase